MTLIKSKMTSVVMPVLILTIKGLLFSFFFTCGFTYGKDLLPPRFVVEPQSVVVRSGSPLVLYCTVEPETATVRWMVNGSYLSSQKRRGFDMRDGSNLRIMSFNQPDSLLHEGVYQCVASNSLGTIVSREAKVEAAVLGSYPSSRTVTDITAIEGNIAVVPCSLPDSKPRAVVEFLYNGSKLTPSGRLVALPSGNLQIARVSRNDQGLYQCSAVNLVTGNSVTSPAAFRLRVVVPVLEVAPVFTSTPNGSITVNQGNNLTLECAAHGWPVPHVTWEKYGGHLPVGRFSQVLGNLVISRIQKFDAGTYLCRVNKSSGAPLEKVINVDVLEPPSIETAPTDQTATEGSTVVFKCRPQGSPKQGSPKPSIQWLFNGELIINEQFVSIRDTTLTLSNIHRRRSGIYQCVVRNGLGMVHAYARLTVIDPQANAKTPPVASPTAPGKQPYEDGYDEYDEENEEEEEDMDYEEYDPGRNQPSETTKRRPEDDKTRNWNSDDGGELLAPTKPKVTVLTNTSVLLNWKMPLVVPGEPAVSKFKIKVKEIIEETSSRWQMLDDDVSYGLRMFEVGNLRPGRTYRFRIMVIYSNGDIRPGPVSARVTVLTATSQRTQMPFPVIVEARPLSKSEIIIGWQQQDMDQWPVEGFYIHYAPFGSNGNFQKVIVPGSSVRHHVLSHLAPTTSYTIRMQSYGKSGKESAFSNTVVKNTHTYDDEVLPGDHVQKFPPGRYASTPRVKEVPATGHPDGREQSLGDASDGNSERQQLTYIILGIGLGVVVIVVVSCASVFVWKRHKNQRYGSGEEQKNADQSTAFLGNKRPSKPDGLVNISDYTYKVDNGHLPNCTGDCTLSAGPHPGNGFCAGKDSRTCPTRPTGQSRKLAPDLVLPPPPSMPPPCHPYHSANTEISIYDTVDDDHQRSSPAYAKMSSLDGDSTGLYTTFPSPATFGNLVRPSSDNIPKPLDSHAYWVLEQSRNQSLPDRAPTHVEPPLAAPQPLPCRQSVSSSSQPSNKSLSKSPFDRDCVIQQSTDEENDRYEKPNSPRGTLHPGLPSVSAFNECDRMNPADTFWPSPASSSNKPSNTDRLLQPEPMLGGRRPSQKPCDASTFGSSTRDPAPGHDSWKNLTSQVSDGQYTIQSGPGKTGPLSTSFALPRVNDYPSSDQEDCR